MPEEAKVESKEGLEAFARYWYELVNYGYETGDTGPVKSVSSTDCLACQNYYKVVDDGYANNDWIAAGEIEVKDAASEYILTREGRYQALAVIQQAGMAFYGPEGLQGTDDGDDGPAVQLFEAVYADGQWNLVFLDTMKTQSP
ncbi:DUF6318 family protein [Arthrobacter sp. zg-Y750]|nr:DUF6318 family protein [Arthrobacter sp. zg-Y750]